MTSPFLKQAATREAVEHLANAERLTIVVGAGASVESGLPNWNSLVSALLRKVGDEAGAPADHAEQFASWSVKADGLPGAGALVKAWLGDRFIDEIRAELYQASGHDPLPGATARAVAALRGAAGDTCEIVTLNYDELLEKALRQAGGFRASNIKTYVGAKKGPASSAVVRHLHGVLTPQRSSGTVVLSESDYHLMQDRGRWQERYMRDRLKRSTCLFVGTSLLDPNLLRYLYRAESATPHVAIFVRQDDSWWFDSAYEAIREPRERSVFNRWRSVSVNPLLADYFSQSAQFVAEVGRCRELGTAYVPYHERLIEWERKTKKTLLRTSGQLRFRTSQEVLQQLLADWCGAVRDFVDALGLLQRDEHLGLHLWVRDPSSRSLVRLASSARVWRDARTLQTVPIKRPTNWVAVEAFCAGTTIAQAPGEHSRWNFVIGLPVVLNTPEWGRLPVGVFTLASTKPRDESGLAALASTALDQVVIYLTGNGARLLTP